MNPDETALIEKFVRLGVNDPEAAAQSEIAEDIPQRRPRSTSPMSLAYGSIPQARTSTYCFT